MGNTVSSDTCDHPVLDLDTNAHERDLIVNSVGDRGLKLSGGEKQRAAIARCLLKVR
jgi:ABC-type transport system involved in cytochrome bd biosynthesis fused ATPase/permease subunit